MSQQINVFPDSEISLTIRYNTDMYGTPYGICNSWGGCWINYNTSYGSSNCSPDLTLNKVICTKGNRNLTISRSDANCFYPYTIRTAIWGYSNILSLAITTDSDIRFQGCFALTLT